MAAVFSKAKLPKVLATFLGAYITFHFVTAYSLSYESFLLAMERSCKLDAHPSIGEQNSEIFKSIAPECDISMHYIFSCVHFSPGITTKESRFWVWAEQLNSNGQTVKDAVFEIQAHKRNNTKTWDYYPRYSVDLAELNSHEKGYMRIYINNSCIQRRLSTEHKEHAQRSNQFYHIGSTFPASGLVAK